MKNPEINLDDLILEEINYKSHEHDPVTTSGEDETLSVHFIFKNSKTQTGSTVTYKGLLVNIAPFGDISKSATTYDSSYHHETKGATYYLNSILYKYNSIVFFISEILTIILSIALYKRFRLNFILIYLFSGVVGLGYLALRLFAAREQPYSLIQSIEPSIYALGLTLSTIAVLLAITYLKTNKNLQ